METLTHGNTVPKSSTTYLLEPLLMEKLSASTEVSVPKLKLSTKSELSIEKLKSHTKDLSATWCGQILKTLKIGQLMLEEQAGYLGQKSLTISAISTESILLPELISLFNKVSFIGSRYSFV